jgi:hypothetical protein
MVRDAPALPALITMRAERVKISVQRYEAHHLTGAAGVELTEFIVVAAACSAC